MDLLTERDEGPVVAVNIAMGGGGGKRPDADKPVRARVPALGETLLRTMMIGSGGAVSAAREQGAWVVTPATLGVGLLEFHQFDRMVSAGRLAARDPSSRPIDISGVDDHQIKRVAKLIQHRGGRCRRWTVRASH